MFVNERAFILFTSALFLLCHTAVMAQSETAVSGYIDLYYTIESVRPEGQRRPAFLYNHHHLDSPRVNLALLQYSAQSGRARSAFGLMAGTYAEENLAHEQSLLRHVFEANVGIALDEAQRWWLDVGVLPSHIGAESAISALNPTLSRSLAAENSPYYQSGARLSWEHSKSLSLRFLVLNGWQRMQPVPGSSIPALGSQVEYAPSEDWTLNWSTYVGSDYPDDERRMRYFNNLFLVSRLNEKLSLTTGLDLGAEQESKGSRGYHKWFTSYLMPHWRFNERWATAQRVEYYRDTKHVIISQQADTEFRTVGYSWNVDYQPASRVLLRLELRRLHSPEAIYPGHGASLRRHNHALLTSFSLSL
jgi:hypothetical protein